MHIRCTVLRSTCAALICLASLPPRMVFADPTPQATPGAALTATTTQISFYRNDTSHTGYIPDQITPPFSLIWRHTTVASPHTPASPIYANGLIYFSIGANVYAISAKDGAVKWQFPATGQASGNFNSTPALFDGSLYVGSDDGQLYKLNAATGVSAWSFKAASAIRSAPIVQDGKVYFGSGDGTCYAVDAETGTPAWHNTLGGAITASPTTANSLLVVTAADNTLNGINTSTGKTTWSIRLSADASSSPPVYTDNEIFVGSGSTLFALAGRTGGERWHQTLTSDITSPPTVGGGMVYVVTQESQVLAFTDRGRARWTATIDYPTNGAPLLAGNVLLVPTRHGIVYGFDADTGKLLWEYVVQPAGTADVPKAASTDIDSAPIYADGVLYILSDDGTLSAFRADASDAIAPVVTNMMPKPGDTIAGVGIPYGATLVDDGSGIKPSTVSITVDGTPIANIKYDPSKNGLARDTTSGTANPVLGDGPHEILLTATDWRGNTVHQKWGFFVDSRLNPAGTVAPPADATPDTTTPPDDTPPPAPGGDGSSTSTSAPGTPGAPAAPGPTTGDPGPPPPPPLG